MKNSNTKKDKQILHRNQTLKSKSHVLVKGGTHSGLLEGDDIQLDSMVKSNSQGGQTNNNKENSFEDEINKIKDLHIHHPSDEIIRLAVSLHHQYELASIRHDWKTQKNCRNKPFKDLPIPNQKVMFDIAILINKDFERIRQKERDNLINDELRFLHWTKNNIEIDLLKRTDYAKKDVMHRINYLKDKLKSQEKDG